MGFYTGRSGSLKIKGKTVAKIRDWSLETTQELLSTNAIDSNFNSFTPGVKGATGSATLLVYRMVGENRGTTTDAFNVLRDTNILGPAGNQSILVRFELNIGSDQPTDADDIIFNGFVTSASMSVSTGELSTASINFTMDGPFVEVPHRTA